ELYIMSTGSPKHVVRLSATGQVAPFTPDLGPDRNPNDSVQSVNVDPHGNVFMRVSHDVIFTRIVEVSPTGQFLRRWLPGEPVYTEFGTIWSLAFDSHGLAFIADGPRVSILDLNGDPMRQLDMP